ncbi:MAG: orotidine-5'-phosphate decarboxylase [Chloroflexi bacterium]|nr:orotidine-5'-phosphate decarboxylase [Chloroflexota bacterium]
MTFLDRLLRASRAHGSLLCIGLDPQPALMPPVSVRDFNRAIVQATQDLVCAYKPNLAFYEALGREGLEALEATLAAIPSGIPIIGDAKRGDVGPSAQAYAQALFEKWGFHAATVNPYLGYDALAPFFDYTERGVFLLCRTSNPGAGDFQDLTSSPTGENPQPLFLHVARKSQEWNRHGNLGLVVGATYPEELRQVRELCPDMPLLIPGIGAQGGDLAAAVAYGVDNQGEKAIICASRSVLYASQGRDFAEAARKEAARLREAMYRGGTA